jgi:lipopolysaccharide/colanic/teichoic acid biosynthesis glycosyltransferase
MPPVPALSESIICQSGSPETIVDSPFPEILDARGFRGALDRERSRSERTEEPFSVITFAARTPGTETQLFHCLLDLLTRVLDAADAVGPLDPQMLGVVLPSRDGSRAWEVVDKLFALLPTGVARPLCNVYTYPTTWSKGDFPEPVYTTLDPKSLRPINGAELLFVRPMPWWKRSLDFVTAGLALLLLAPLFCVIALAIKLTSRGPIFFKQRRSGLGGKPFVMCKFRTMVVDAEVRKQTLMHANEQDGPAFKIKADPRVTWLGRVLRKTSLDELPQLWNVLQGDMSLVGPRPLPCVEMAGCTTWQRRRLDVSPGLTCIWQVYGRSRVTFTEWVQMDVEYIKTRSLLQDLKLILITVPALLFRPGH